MPVVSLVTLALAVGVETRGATAAPPAPPCSARALNLSDRGGQGSGSHRYRELELRNVSQRRCRIDGYPGIRMLGTHGGTIVVRVNHCSSLSCFGPLGLAAPGLSLTDRVTTLAPHTVSVFYLGFDTGCTPTDAARCPFISRVAITAPGVRRAFSARPAVGAHANRSPVNVSPLIRPQPAGSGAATTYQGYGQDRPEDHWCR